MWYFEQRYRDESGTLQSLKIPLRDHIEELKRDDWTDRDIAVAVLRGAKWVDCSCDEILPDGRPVELVPGVVSDEFNELEFAIEAIKRSEWVKDL